MPKLFMFARSLIYSYSNKHLISMSSWFRLTDCFICLLI